MLINYKQFNNAGRGMLFVLPENKMPSNAGDFYYDFIFASYLLGGFYRLAHKIFFLTGNNASDSFTIPVTDGQLNLYAGSGVGTEFSISALEIEQTSTGTETKPTIWICGDSTAASRYNIADDDIHGWGQYLGKYVDTGQYDIRNISANWCSLCGMVWRLRYRKYGFNGTLLFSGVPFFLRVNCQVIAIYLLLCYTRFIVNHRFKNMKGGNNMKMQENEMQKIPSDIMQMITYETFCRFKASRQGKSAMAAYDWKVQEVVAARKYYSGWYHCWAKHITGGLVMDSYYLRIKDLDRISFHSRESVDTAVYHVIPGKNPDDLKYNLDYINRKEIEALADQSGCIYLFNKCVGRVRRIQCETVRYDIVIRNGTDAITDSALADNYQIGSVTLPDSVTVIGTGALERSRLLEKVTLSQNLKYIKDAAFRFC